MPGMFESDIPRQRRGHEVVDIASLCRVCLSSIGRKEPMSIATKLSLSQIFQGQVRTQENWKICMACLSFVNKAAEFRIMVKESDRRVKEIQNAGQRKAKQRSKSMYVTEEERTDVDEVTAVLRTIERERRMVSAIVLSSDEESDKEDECRRSASTLSITSEAPPPQPPTPPIPAVKTTPKPATRVQKLKATPKKAIPLPSSSPPRVTRTLAALKYFPPSAEHCGPPPERRAAIAARSSFKPEPKKQSKKKPQTPKEKIKNAEQKLTVKNGNWKCCQMVFKREQELHGHKYMLHARLQNFNCQICLEKIKGRANLVRHIKANHLPEKYTKVCSICSKSYYTSNGVKYHMKAAHPELFQ